MREFLTVVANFLKNFGTNVLEAVALLLAGVVIIKLFSRLLRTLIKRTRVEGAAGSFIVSIVQAALALFLFFVIMGIFNIDTSSIVTVLAASGLAIGLALQDGLSNFASGVTLLVTRPFKEKDHVKINDIEGKIKKVRLTTTEILTFDNVSILIPNKKVSSSEIINFSNRPTRRIDITVSASYGADPDKVKEILMELIGEELDVLLTPAPVVLLSELGSSSVSYLVRMWTNTENYWAIRNAFLEKVFKRFKAEGLAVPYQKLNVIMSKEGDKNV